MSSISGYDDVSMFSPDGKVKPLAYIKNTVELGSTTVGLCNSRCGVILVYTGSSPLSYPNKKIFKINDTCVFAFSGITNDGLEIVDQLHNESVWLEVYQNKRKTIEMFKEISTEASLRTIYNRNRLFGVGGLMLCKKESVELIEFEPTGNTQYVYAASIGTRSQVAATMLEKNVRVLENMEVCDLIYVGVEAIRNANPTEDVKSENIEAWCLTETVEKFDISDIGL